MSSREKLRQAIEELDDEQVESVQKAVDELLQRSDDEALQKLMSMPGIRMGKEMDPERKRFVPIKVEGELPSEILIRERR